MVCVDQENAEKNGEPFVTLAKTRRVDGRVVFGVHTALAVEKSTYVTIKAGDVVKEIAPLVAGRGGGKPDLAQGSGTDAAGIDAALNRLRDVVGGR